MVRAYRTRNLKSAGSISAGRPTRAKIATW